MEMILRLHCLPKAPELAAFCKAAQHTDIGGDAGVLRKGTHAAKKRKKEEAKPFQNAMLKR